MSNINTRTSIISTDNFDLPPIEDASHFNAATGTSSAENSLPKTLKNIKNIRSSVETMLQSAGDYQLASALADHVKGIIESVSTALLPHEGVEAEELRSSLNEQREALQGFINELSVGISFGNQLNDQVEHILLRALAKAEVATEWLLPPEDTSMQHSSEMSDDQSGSKSGSISNSLSSMNDSISSSSEVSNDSNAIDHESYEEYFRQANNLSSFNISTFSHEVTGGDYQPGSKISEDDESISTHSQVSNDTKADSKDSTSPAVSISSHPETNDNKSMVEGTFNLSKSSRK